MRIDDDTPIIDLHWYAKLHGMRVIVRRNGYGLDRE